MTSRPGPSPHSCQKRLTPASRSTLGTASVFHAGAVSLRPGATRRLGMRVIECNECGETLSAANDEELAKVLVDHMKSEHPDAEFEPDQASEVVGESAYTATDS